MAKPRVFISSTYYDLKYIRAGIELFVRDIGYEPILFEKGDIPFSSNKPLEDACYQEVDTADMLVLIIGGRFGSVSNDDIRKIDKDSGEYISCVRNITKREYEKATIHGLETFVFIDQCVFAEYKTYKANKGNHSIKYVHVDDPRIYEIVEDIISQNANFIKEFSNLEDITLWLRDQWAGIFADLLKKKNISARLRNLEGQIEELSSVVNTLKTYSEVLVGKAAPQIVESENLKLRDEAIKKFDGTRLVALLRQGEEIDLSTEEILSKLLPSSDLVSFLRSVGLSDERIDGLIHSFSGIIMDDYTRAKRRFAPLLLAD